MILPDGRLLCASSRLVCALACACALLAGAPSAQQPGTAAVSGVISDAASGRPIAGAIVSLRLQVAPGTRFGQQLTDARGRFVFDELPAAKQFILDATKPGYVDAHYGQLPGVPISVRFALAEGQWLSTAHIEMVKLGGIGGVVTDEFGEPVVGALVRALAEVIVGGRREWAAGPIARTDDRGEYRLGGLLPARYVVMLPSVQHSVPASTTPAQVEGLRDDMYARLEAALARNPATAHVNNGAAGDGDTRLILGNFVTPPAPAGGHDRVYPITFAPGAMSIAAAAPIALGSGEEKSGINLSLQPVAAVRVSGRLDGMTTPGRLTLRLLPAGLEGLGPGSEGATTIVNGDGTFTFLDVPAGAYTLETRQSTFEFTSDPVYVPNKPSLPRTPGHELLGYQLVDSFAGAPPGFGYSFKLDPPGPSYTGRLPVTVAGADIANLVVSVHPAVTIQGRYVYEDMPNGPPQRANIMFAAPAGGNWGAGPAASLNEGPDGEPESFTMRGVGPGAYALQPTPPPGAVVKSILIDGQDYLKKPFDVVAGRDVNGAVITFTGKVPTLSGAVRRTQGGAAERATILAFSTDRATWPDFGLAPVVAKVVLASADGTFTLSSLPAGDYYVIALDGWHASGWTDPAYLAKAAAIAMRVSLAWGVSTSVDLTMVTIK